MEENRGIMEIMNDMKALADGIISESQPFISEARAKAKAKARRNLIEDIASEMACAIDDAVCKKETTADTTLTLPCGVEIQVVAYAGGDVEVLYYNDNDWRGHDNVTAAIEEAVVTLPDFDDWECRIEKKFQDEEIEKSLFELDYCRSVV